MTLHGGGEPVHRATGAPSQGNQTKGRRLHWRRTPISGTGDESCRTGCTVRDALWRKYTRDVGHPRYRWCPLKRAPQQPAVKGSTSSGLRPVCEPNNTYHLRPNALQLSFVLGSWGLGDGVPQTVSGSASTKGKLICWTTSHVVCITKHVKMRHATKTPRPKSEVRRERTF